MQLETKRKILDFSVAMISVLNSLLDPKFDARPPTSLHFRMASNRSVSFVLPRVHGEEGELRRVLHERSGTLVEILSRSIKMVSLLPTNTDYNDSMS